LNGESDFSRKKLYPVFESATEIKTEEPATDTPTCPHCNSENVYGISRVVGYFSIIDNWNNSKKSELKRRQKGNYWSEKK